MTNTFLFNEDKKSGHLFQIRSRHMEVKNPNSSVRKISWEK